MLAIANCQHSYSYVLPFCVLFLHISNYDVNKPVWCANLAIEDSTGEQQALTIVGDEASIGGTVNEARTHDWTISVTKSLVKVAWAWVTVEVAVIYTALNVVPAATHVTMTNSLCGGNACATH